ncbi:hypothetical protein GG804_15775 [Sphingomonas histidinilytica]|jgi:hypothetical protein|uniref:Lipoprotein n=1 Tax=Rhizorhabdus histidinilytica TaxID=439228 RepID=A0A1T4ZQL7_9SPHN|nr:hypothetical protein [Rhizorhabdus histidinilytica]MBO9378228.1 hypothetical protein [Rhizorhabdus histidinilytica]QEH78805.1 hypothetical protein EIK56_11845 [Sphingomonas sp. C8-2]SKB24990.1 hypothetical protein SAMN06295920_10142 [Rhizorhabdus histidinilytica]
MLKRVQQDGYGRELWIVTAGLLLTACGSAGDAVAGTRPIDCRLAEARGFEQICTVERTESPEGPVLVARGPDGGFRRLLIVRDGRGVIAADGAEPVEVRPAGGGHVDVTAGGMVYRLPAKVAA